MKAYLVVIGAILFQMYFLSVIGQVGYVIKAMEKHFGTRPVI